MFDGTRDSRLCSAIIYSEYRVIAVISKGCCLGSRGGMKKDTMKIVVI